MQFQPSLSLSYSTRSTPVLILFFGLIRVSAAFVLFARVISERKLLCASHVCVRVWCVVCVKVNGATRYRFTATPPQRRT